MNIKHLITNFLIVSVAAASSTCLSKKPQINKPVEITFSAAFSLKDDLKEMGAQFQEN